MYKPGPVRVPLSHVQERVEKSELGRVLISAFLVLTFVVIFTLNLPWQYNFELKRQLARVASPYSRATGLQQAWSVFAPMPRATSIALTARVSYADGSHRDWEIPRQDAFLGAFVSTRWRKWMEVAWQDETGARVGRTTALWLARRFAHEGRRPVEVTLIRRWRDVPPLGVDRSTRWQQKAYYHLTITPRMLAGTA